MPDLDALIAELQALYLADQLPWVLAVSGGKDSTATAQLVWAALAALPPAQRHKPVHVISTDTGVEQPLVAAWATSMLDHMQAAADAQGLPLETHRLQAPATESFWVHVIGKGYGAPSRAFRFCTDRLKVRPANRFMQGLNQAAWGSITILGTRRAESTGRAQTMAKYESASTRKGLSQNGSMANGWVCTPVADWSHDDVWEFLLTHDNPWGVPNRDLFDLYRGANPDRECPVILDMSAGPTDTATCGGSRFGCWTCTIVRHDRSLQATIDNNPTNAWMQPLADFRNELAASIHDHDLRDFRRSDGQVRLGPDGRPNPGPYIKSTRERWLEKLLTLQRDLRTTAPPAFQDWTLIRDDEVREIRRLWVQDKHEWDDTAPVIWERVFGTPYPYLDDLATPEFSRDDWQLLEDVTDGNRLMTECLSTLLDLEVQARRAGVRAKPEDFRAVLRRTSYTDAEDAAAVVRAQQAQQEQVLQGERDTPVLTAAPAAPRPASRQLALWELESATN